MVLASLSLTACFSLKQPAAGISYYTLEYDHSKVKEMEPLSRTIGIENFTVSPLYDSTGIVFKENEYLRDSYFYHKWRVNPGEMVTDLLTGDMRNAGVFRAVMPPGSRMTGVEYVLSGNVDKFYEESEDSQWYGVISLSISLIKEEESSPEKRILFQRSYSRKQICEKKNPRSLAKALSSAMQEISREILDDVYNRLKENK